MKYSTPPNYAVTTAPTTIVVNNCVSQYQRSTLNNVNNKCLGCSKPIGIGAPPVIPESILAKITPQQSLEDALWEHIMSTPGYCTDCHHKINEASSTLKKEMLAELTPERREFLDNILDDLTDVGTDFVDSIITWLEIKDIPPRLYTIVAPIIVKNFVMLIAASMLSNVERIDEELFTEFKNKPHAFIHRVWRQYG